MGAEGKREAMVNSPQPPRGGVFCVLLNHHTAFVFEAAPRPKEAACGKCYLTRLVT